MFIINEKIEKFSNFFAPSMLVAFGALLLGFLQNVAISILILNNFTIEMDILIFSLLLTFLSQVVGSLIVYFLVIPLMKTKDVHKNNLTARNFIRNLLMFCLTFAVNILSNYIFIFFFNLMNIAPQSGYTGILLNPSQLNNPLNVIIYFLPLAIGAPIFEELLYRRSIIPMLEKRGMAPFTAILISSIVFAVAHLPNDIVNGNIYGGIMHCIGVFYISIFLGIAYVITRNILFPIIIHSLVNFISFSGPLVNTIGNETLQLIFNILIICIGVIGVGILIYSIWRFLKRKSTNWVILLRNKSSHNVKLGSYSFLIIGIISAFVPITIELYSTNILIQSNNFILYFTILIISYSIGIILSFWLGIRARFEFKDNKRMEV